MMRVILVGHIVAGGLGLVAGYIALYATKGATLHRRSGMAFVFAMLAMSVGGMLMAAVRGVAPAVNIPASVLTAYLVITALAAIRPPAAGSRWLDIGAMLVALTVAVTSLTFGFEALANGGKRNGMPAFPFLLFGGVGLLAGLLDVRMISRGRLQGTSRLVRHLWRMSFALFVAALSFFLGQAEVIPEPIRIRGLLALPVLAVLVTMFYWLWRVRRRKTIRRSITFGSQEALSMQPQDHDALWAPSRLSSAERRSSVEEEPMLKVSKYCFLLAVTGYLLLAQPAVAAENSRRNLVDVHWLEKHLGGAGVLVLDASSTQQYMDKHIPGAVSVDMLTYGGQEMPVAETEQLYQS